MLKSTLAFTTFLFIFYSALCQQSQVFSDTLVEELVITHSKIPVSIRSAFKPTIIIDQAEIDQQVTDDISELLDRQVGIQVNSAYSNPGKDKSVFLQGAMGEFTLILIDGVPLTDPSGIGGTFDLRSISLSQIERIEIVKGGQSVLYGSDAIAGVINLISKDASLSKTRLGLNANYGSLNTRDLSANITLPLGSNIALSFNGADSSSDGISEALDENGSGFEKDGFSRQSLQSSLRWKVKDQLTITPFVNVSSFDGNYDGGAFTDGTDTYETQWFRSGLSMDYMIKSLTLKGSYTYNKTDRTFDSSFGISAFKGRFQNLDLFGQFKLHKTSHLIFGVNRQHLSMIDANSAVIDPDANLTSLYTTLLHKPSERTNVELGARHNIHSTYGANTIYSMGASHWLSEQVKLHGYYSTSFKAPNLFQLFGQFGANPDLNPQNGQSLNLGLSFNDVGLFDMVSFEFFDRKVDELIIFDFATGYLNLPSQHDQGIEVSVGASFDKVYFNTSYAYLIGERVDQSGMSDPVSNLIRRPKHQFDGQVSYQYIENGTINFNLRYSGNREDSYFDTATFFVEDVVLDAYWLSNMTIDYRFNTVNLKIYGKVRNLFNTDFQEVAGFSTIGRNVHLGLSWSL